MNRFIEIVRSALLDHPDDRMLKRIARSALLLCPSLVLLFTLAMDGLAHFWLRFRIGITIALTVSLFCHLSVGSLLAWQRRTARRKGLPYQRAGRARTAFYSFAAMFPGTYVGLRVAARVFAHVGHGLETSLSRYTSGLLMGSMILGVVVLAELHRDSQDAEQKARWRLVALERERMQAQIAALTAQMNPHLLFNALNTIAAMIPTAPERAEEMTVMLSDLYRGVLSASQRAKHSLATEIDLCRAYLDVERARFGDRLQVSLDIPPGVPTDAIQIPVLTLQPLVENTVRHGVAPRSSGGWVRVGARENGGDVELTIADDGVGFGRSPAKGGSGTGLANCRERLRLHYGDRGNLRIDTPQGGGTRVTVTFPAVSA